MNNPFIYIVLNGALNMSPGKAAAQAVHALASLDKEYGISEFSQSIKRTVIVLEAKDQQQLYNLETYLFHLDIPAESYIDEGVNEVSAYSVTALAIGPIAEDDLEKRQIVSAFPLFPAYKKKRKFFHK